MHIWLFQIGETYPFQKDARKMRMASLSDVLCERGHSVLWWGSNFHHPTKTQLYEHDMEIEITPNYKIILLKGLAYKSNISLKRYIGCKLIAGRFKRKVEFYNRPDLIVIAIPDYDLAYEAILFAKKYNIPTVVDIRDLWPDIFIDRAPMGSKTLVKLALFHDFKKVKTILKKADSLVACSKTYLKWGLEKIGQEKTEKDKVFYFGYKKPVFGMQEIVRKQVIDLCLAIKNKIVFAFVGSFGYSYDLSLVVQAAHIFEKEGMDNVHFVFVGDGVKWKKIRREASGLSNISFTGWLNAFEIRKVLETSDVGLVTYVKDAPQSMPYKLFEYISYGLPLLSSLEGELKVFLEKYQIGISYTSGDLGSFCDCVKKFLNCPDRLRSMSLSASGLFKTKLNADIISKDYAVYLEGLTKTNKQGQQ